jgi:ribosomal subunit interface protein
MEIRTRTNDYEMTPEVDAYLGSRLAHLKKLLGSDAELARCEVVLGRDAGRPRHGANVWFAELQVTYPGSQTFRANNRSESINGAIDDAKAELERQLTRDRKLHIKLLRKGGAMFKSLIRRGGK